MHNTLPQKKNMCVRNIVINIVSPKKKFISLISYFSKHICIFICAYKCSFVHVHISIHKCIFCALTCLQNMWSIPKTYNGMWNQRKQRRKCTKRKPKDIKREQSIWPFKTENDGKDGKVLTRRAHRQKRIVDQSPALQEKRQKDMRKRMTNAAHSNRPKLKRMVRMGRCLLVERVDEDGSLIGVPNCKIWAEKEAWAKGSTNWKSEERKRNEGMGARSVTLKWGLTQHHVAWEPF